MTRSFATPLVRLPLSICLALALALAACSSTPDANQPSGDASHGAGGHEATAPLSNAHPPNPDLDKGKDLVTAQKFDDAAPVLEKALATDPKSGEAAFYLGVAYEGLNRKPDAEAKYKLALQNDANLVEAATNLAAMYLDDPARAGEAIPLLEHALKVDPGNAKLLQNIGYAYGLKNDPTKASVAYEAALKIEDTAQLRFAYGSMLFDNKKLDEAVPQLDKAAAGITDVPTLATIARMMGSAKAFDKCVKLLDKAIAAKGDQSEFWVRRGTCKHELKDEKGAGDDFRGALKIDPKFAPAHYYLGMSLLAQKKKAEAKAELKKAYDLDKESPIGKLAKQRLDETK